MALEGVPVGLFLMKELGWSWTDLQVTPHRVAMEMLASIRLQRELDSRGR